MIYVRFTIRREASLADTGATLKLDPDAVFLSDEGPESFLVQNLPFYQPPCFSYLSVNLLIPYQSRDVLGAPGCSVHILRIVPSGDLYISFLHKEKHVQTFVLAHEFFASNTQSSC